MHSRWQERILGILCNRNADNFFNLNVHKVKKLKSGWDDDILLISCPCGATCSLCDNLVSGSTDQGQIVFPESLEDLNNHQSLMMTPGGEKPMHHEHN